MHAEYVLVRFRRDLNIQYRALIYNRRCENLYKGGIMNQNIKKKRESRKTNHN